MGADTFAAAQSQPLTDAQVAAWHRDGFLILDRFISTEAIAELRTAYDDILAGTVTISGDRMLGDITRQVMFPSQGHPLFDRNPAVDRGLEIAGQLFGADVDRTFDMLIYKPPGHGHDTPWHQDFAYGKMPFVEAGREMSNRSIQFWVPLDDVDLETGCMLFLPGYHTRPLLEHHVASGSPSDEGRLLAMVDPDSQVDLARALIAEIPAGGCTMHAAKTPHYTGPNRSADRHRRSYIFSSSTA